MNRTIRLLSALAVLALSLATSQAFAQGETLRDLMPEPPRAQSPAKGFEATIRLFDSVLIHPLPDWMPREIQGDPMSSTLFSRQEKGNVFRMEMVPKEETFQDWRNLYAVMGLRNYPGTISDHARQIITLFRSGCSPSNLAIRPPQGNANIALLIIACGSFSRQAGMGEVAVFVLLHRGKTAVRLYREWRGKAFRAEDRGQWPVKRKTLDHVIRTMTQARLVPDS